MINKFIKVALKVLRLFDKKSEAQTKKHLLTETSYVLVKLLIACFVTQNKVDIFYYGARLLVSIPMAFCNTKAKVKKAFSKKAVKGLWVRRLAQRTPWGVFCFTRLKTITFKNGLVEFSLSCYTEGGFDEQIIALEWLLALFFLKRSKKVRKEGLLLF